MTEKPMADDRRCGDSRRGDDRHPISPVLEDDAIAVHAGLPHQPAANDARPSSLARR